MTDTQETVQAGFIAERDAIFIAMDQEAAKRFITTHGGTLPKGRLDWERVLHMARFECMSISPELRTDSHIWLARNGAESLATIDPEGPDARAILDLLFPRDEFNAFMADRS